MPLRTEPLHAMFGITLHDIDFAESRSTETLEQIRNLMDQHALVAIRDQIFDDEQHIALSRAFGPLELPPDARH